MNLEINLSHLIALGLAFFGALWALVKIIGAQQQQQLSEKFASLNQALNGFGGDLRREADATRLLETSFLRFQAELPRDYVRRDDFVRTLATLETRIDNFALRMERALSQQKE